MVVPLRGMGLSFLVKGGVKMRRIFWMFFLIAVFVSVVPAVARVSEGAFPDSIPGLSETALPDSSRFVTDSSRPDDILVDRNKGFLVGVTRHYFVDDGEGVLYKVALAVRMPWVDNSENWVFNPEKDTALWFWHFPTQKERGQFAAFADANPIIIRNAESIAFYAELDKENRSLVAVRVVIRADDDTVLTERVFKRP